MRLDIFLPFLKKAKKNAAPPVDSLALRCAKRVLPKALFADRGTGNPGLIRRTLKRTGPTVLSSPVRRMVQAACFLLFLWLFFYVCWPYGALPREAKLLSDGWTTAGPDQQTGELEFMRPSPPPDGLAAPRRIHLVDQSKTYAVDGYLGEFAVVTSEGGALRVKPLRQLTPEQIDQLLLGRGPWAVYDAHPWPAHYTEELASKEFVQAESFLIIDPLVAVSTAIAARSWVWSLTFAGIILAVCVLVPRGFCGYLCPLGTLIDLFDWLIGRRVRWLRVPDDGWWVHIKYYLLAGTLVASMCGLLVSGYVAAIPVITRGMLFLGEPLQTALLRGRHEVVPFGPGHFVSIGLFFLVLVLGLLKPRFWCKYVCPSGAVFSLGNLLRAAEGRIDLHQLQQVRRDLPLRRHQARLHHPHQRLHALPDLRRRLPHAGDQVRRPLGEREPQGRERSRHARNAARPPRLSLAGGGHGGRGGRRRQRRARRAGLRRTAGKAARAAARQCARARVPRHVHPLRRMLQGLPVQRAAGQRFRQRLGVALDTAGGRRLGRLRFELQRLRAGLPHRRDPRPAARREARGADGTGDRRRGDVPADRRPRKLPGLRRRM